MSQRLGIPLARIREALATLPTNRVPTSKDWARLSAGWRQDLDDRILHLERLRDNLAGCIGCGCLSLKTCALSNPGDVLAAQGLAPSPLILERLCDRLAVMELALQSSLFERPNAASSATARGSRCAPAGSPTRTRCSTS